MILGHTLLHLCLQNDLKRVLSLLSTYIIRSSNNARKKS